MADPTDGAHETDASVEALAEACARAALAAGVRVVAAESLTSGAISTALGTAHEASEWFAGAVVAYDAEVKFTVLGVDRGPVITPAAARQMAEGVLALMPAEVAVAVTGVGGPGPEEGRPPGTVYIAHGTRDGARGGTRDGAREERMRVDAHRFAGGPAEVVEQTVQAALRALLADLGGLG